MDNVTGLALPLFILIFLGFLAGKIVPDDRRELLWLDVFVVYFALPALVLGVVAGAPLDRIASFTYVLATSLSAYVTFMLMFIVAVSVGRVRIGVAALQASAASHGNASHIGVPLAFTVFGAEGALPAILIFAFDSLVQFALVSTLQSVERPQAGRKAVSVAARSLAFNPMLIALVLGVLIAAVDMPFPALLGNTLGLLAQAAAAAAMFAIGVTIARQRLGHVRWEVPVITLCKLVVQPFVALSIVLLMGGFEPIWIAVAVLMAALPTGAGVFELATRFDTYADSISNSVLITTFLSLATLSALVVLISEGGLPLQASDLF